MSANTPRCYSYIRFSRPEQITGDSLNRQLKLSQEYAEKKGLILDESLTLKDLGISAFSGEHRTKGTLGKFFELVENGEIPQGSILIVESLDRLSREQVLTAFNMFLQLINAGITIITLADNMEYSVDSIEANAMQLMMSLTIMTRAREESVMKAQRLRKAWASKRENIHSKKLTARAPAWLKLDRKTQTFNPISERERIVKKIFTKYLNGTGPALIAKELNLQKTDWQLKNGWRKSYIIKILNNPAVIGKFQPHEKRDGKKIPSGPPIPDYYPRIISDTVFYRAQEKLSINRGKGGRNTTVHNLFGHIAKCGYCGSPMQFVNKSKGWTYLVCDKARRGLKCEYTSFKYKEFEEAFIKFCSELNVKGLFPSKDDKKSIIQSLRAELESLKGQILSLNKTIENLDYQVKIAETPQAINHVTKNLQRALTDRDKANKRQGGIENKLDKLLSRKDSAKAQLKDIRQLLNLLKTETGNELTKLRAKLRSEIRQLVKVIHVFPNGPTDNVLNEVGGSIQYTKLDTSNDEFLGELLKEYDPDIFQDKRSHLAFLKKLNESYHEHISYHTGDHMRRFGIFFDAGGFKEVAFINGKYEIGVFGKSYEDIIDSAAKLTGLTITDSPLKHIKSFHT